MNKKTFDVTGMTCASCSAHVEKAVSSLPGVKEVSVSLLTNTMGVEFDSPATEQGICGAVAAAGYGAVPRDGSTGEKKSVSREALTDSETPKLLRRLIASLFLLLPLMYVSMGHLMWGCPVPQALA